MSIEKPVSENFKRFLDFFNLKQRERLDGLDKSYFDPMTPEEKSEAFAFLKAHVEVSEENIRGIYLCDPDRAIALFKSLIPKELPKTRSKREKEAFVDCKVLMAGIIANEELSEESINRLISLQQQTVSAANRANVYKQIPNIATTEKAIEFLKKSLIEENDVDPLSFAIDTFLSLHGIKFTFRDENYRKIYSCLLDGSSEEKMECINQVMENNAVIYV